MTGKVANRERPERFYKYMSRSTAKIVLENRTLRWSVPSLLNDPFDVQFDLHINNIDRQRIKALALPKMWEAFFGEHPFTPGNKLGLLMAIARGRLKKMTREEFDNLFGPGIDEGFDNLLKHLPEHQADIRKYMAKTKVICFSEVPDSILMWAYYAEQQKGAVLCFRAPEEADSPLLHAQPLNYSKHVPPLVTDEFLADMSAGLVKMDAKSLIERMTTTKALEWGHEREWRITLGHGRKPDALFEDLSFRSEELDSVILGCLTPREEIEALSKLTREKYPKAKLQQVVKADGEFKLIIKDLELREPLVAGLHQ
jgi:hypothetical protein